MKPIKLFYLIMAIIGTVVPWLFFAGFFGQAGFDLPFFVRSLFANGAAGGFSADVLISIVVFFVWATLDGAERRVRFWWLIFPAGLTVGLSLALPLYLYLRTND